FDSDGTPDFDVLYGGVNDGEVSACAFDLLMLNGEDFRCKPYVDRKAALRKLVRPVAASSTSSTPKVMATGCLRQSADLALRASFLRNWMRPIVQGRRTLRRRLKFIIQGSTRPKMIRNLGYIFLAQCKSA